MNRLTRRNFLEFSIAIGTVRALQEETRPKVLLLMSDQWRFDCLGASGNSLITPNLDWNGGNLYLLRLPVHRPLSVSRSRR